MNIRAKLDGHELDLAALAHHFSTGDPRVVSDDEGTFIEASALETIGFDNSAGLVDTASHILAELNGAARLEDPGYRPVKLRNRFHRAPSDTHTLTSDEARLQEHATVLVVGAVEARIGLSTTVTGKSIGSIPGPAPEPKQRKHLTRAAAHPNVADLLTLIGRTEDLSWDVLWKAMEIVRADLGGTAALLATNWITADDFDVFGYSANHPDASGPAARHARRPPGTPPPWTMSIEQGQQFIRNLTREWLDSLR
ncbi:hypothetical protein [Actinokineospora globicatena]|uniref:Uncharacterized protein n=1 Tax=Actinokineospora globicatena TaxID=103729 RepID=A0A9W6V5B3_9PSEU|nr:hypothetical protein [Actinokineospora globicatena]GLW90155.1 hypothetical protein Aglo03_09710 [Actinokineospora globicatena]